MGGCPSAQRKEMAAWRATPGGRGRPSRRGCWRCWRPSTRDTGALALSELARRAGLPPPTAHRLVAELVAAGFLARLPDGRYVVGRRLWDLGLLAPVQSGLRQVAAPFLHDLYGATLAHRAPRRARRRPGALRRTGSRGRRRCRWSARSAGGCRCTATGVGKVLLAYAPADVAGAGPRRTSPASPVHRSPRPGLLAERAAPGAPGRLRPDGRGDERSGACSVAVPVLTPSGGRRRPSGSSSRACGGTCPRLVLGAAGRRARHRPVRRRHATSAGSEGESGPVAEVVRR